MQLTRYMDYSLRLMIFLGLHPERKVTIAEVARAFGISRHHLVKVAHRLSLKGLIAASKGRGGGMRLMRPADQITVGEVLRKIKENLQPIECFKPLCPLVPGCRLRGALFEAQNNFLATLDRYTIAKLIEPRGELIRLVG
jgi:Rrf2 family nitric oxide-sensitive transcriptional repressor